MPKISVILFSLNSSKNSMQDVVSAYHSSEKEVSQKWVHIASSVFSFSFLLLVF